jgi:hypothetical protein
MLFGCNVKLVPNESKTHFERAVVDKRTFYLDHYVMDEDVNDLNLMREEVKKALLSRGGLEHCQLWTHLRKVIGRNCTRIHFNIDEKWVRVLEEDKKVFLREIRKESIVIYI